MKKNFWNYVEIFRISHWFKNIVVIFGALGAILVFNISALIVEVIAKVSLAVFLSCLISSVNYAVNNIADARNDSFHPIKKRRVLPEQKISLKSIYLIICFLLFNSLMVAKVFYGNLMVLALFSLFVAGLIYNVKPLRFKDLPVLDVLSESINNPIRFFVGWFSVSKNSSLPPLLVLLFFWFLGAILMSAKRYSELKFFLSSHKGIFPYLYRNSYRFYTLGRIFKMIVFYLIATIVLFIFVAIKYKNKLLYSLPLVLLTFTWFFKIMTEEDSPLKDPESILVKKPLFSLVSLLTVLTQFYLSII